MEAFTRVDGSIENLPSSSTADLWQVLLAGLKPIKTNIETRVNNTLELSHDYQPVFFRVQSGKISYLLQRRKLLRAEAGECLGAFYELPGLVQSTRVEEAGEVEMFRTSDLKNALVNSPERRKTYQQLRARELSITAKALAPNLDNDSKFLEPRMKRFKPGKVVIREGEKSSDVYVLVSGRAAVLVSGKAVGIVKEGEIFGAIGALTGEARTATVKTLNPCKIASYSAAEFQQLILDCPGVVTKMLGSLSIALVSANQKLLRG